jgi:hypothetical protein
LAQASAHLELQPKAMKSLTNIVKKIHHYRAIHPAFGSVEVFPAIALTQ